jgi:hypothetical protein
MEIKNTISVIEEYFSKRAGISIYVNCASFEDAQNEMLEIAKVMGEPTKVYEDDLTVFVDYDKITFVLTINNEGESTWKK